MWVKLGTLRGKDGLHGNDGLTGAPGKDGEDGHDGVSILDVQQRTKDSFTIILSDKTEKTFQLPKLKGKGIAGGAGQDTYFRSGNGVPNAGLGSLGDHYLDKDTSLLYGPKTGSGWGAGVSLGGGGGGDRYLTTSTTSNTIVSSGSLTFTVDAGLSYIPMQEVLIVHDASNHMHASITSYSGTTMIVDVKQKTGSGTYNSWTINLDGTPVDALTGSGTTNEIAYFTSGQTLASLSTATYPNLTEFSYTKGLTSSAQAQLDDRVVKNAPITGSTKTKITYDAKGLVTAGADATTADIADSSNKRYVTDAQLVVIGNTSGTNTGDVTVTDSSEIDFTLTGQNITASLIAGSIDETKLDASVNASLDLADTALQNISGQDLSTADNTISQFTTLAAVAGVGYLTGNQTITLSGDVTGSGATAITATLATVNANVGSFGSATQVGTFTVNAKGLITAASNTSIQIAESQVTNLVSDLAAKQDTLVSGTNIKTINGSSVLGSGDLVVSGGANTTLSNLGTTAINASLLFNADNTYDIGNATNKLRTLYIANGGYIEFGNSADVLLVHSSNLLTLVGGSLHIGNNLKLDVTNGLIGNESGGTTQDFRWETDTDANGLFVDASANTVTARGVIFNNNALTEVTSIDSQTGFDYGFGISQSSIGLFDSNTGETATLYDNQLSIDAGDSTNYSTLGAQYLNFGITVGSSGYGIRNNSGAIEAKNSGGAWSALPTTVMATGETITSTTLANIAGLTVAVAAGTYLIEAEIHGNSSTTAGYTLGINHSGATTSLEANQMGQLSTTTLAATARITAVNTSSTVCGTTANAETRAFLAGKIVVSTSGNITIQGRKVTSGNFVVRSSSWLKVTKVA